MSNSKMSYQMNEEFLRQVVFMGDGEKVLSIFPFYHLIKDEEYENFIEEYEYISSKNDLCLMYEIEFGWGWIQGKLLYQLEILPFDEYQPLLEDMISQNIIKPSFVLNEDYVDTLKQ